MSRAFSFPVSLWRTIIFSGKFPKKVTFVVETRVIHDLEDSKFGAKQQRGRIKNGATENGHKYNHECAYRSDIQPTQNFRRSCN